MSKMVWKDPHVVIAENPPMKMGKPAKTTVTVATMLEDGEIIAFEVRGHMKRTQPSQEVIEYCQRQRA